MDSPIGKYHEKPVNKWVATCYALVNGMLMVFAVAVFVVPMDKGVCSIYVSINNLNRTMQADSSVIQSNDSRGETGIAGKIAPSHKVK